MATINVLVMIHGITLDDQPGDHQAEYDAMWNGLTTREAALKDAFADVVRVEWGHRPAGVATAALRDDQRIMDAENTIRSRTGADAVAANHEPENHVLGPFADPAATVVSMGTRPIKEKIEMLGITDAFYYISRDGEDRIRNVVYNHVLGSLSPYRDAEKVQLHLIGHSLGSTLAHDFLFGLFAPAAQLTDRSPGFLSNPQASPEDQQEYAYWRSQAGTRLLLGSKTSTGSQIGLMMMRKQALVDLLAAGGRVDPSVIGISSAGTVKWRIFYDLIDVLGFPIRSLYTNIPSIEEYQVDNGPNPENVHSLYWTNQTVIQKTADLLLANLGQEAPGHTRLNRLGSDHPLLQAQSGGADSLTREVSGFAGNIAQSALRQIRFGVYGPPLDDSPGGITYLTCPVDRRQYEKNPSLPKNAAGTRYLCPDHSNTELD